MLQVRIPWALRGVSVLMLAFVALVIGVVAAPAAQASCAAGQPTAISPTTASAGATVVLTSGEFGDCYDQIVNGKPTGKPDAVKVRFQQGDRSVQVGAVTITGPSVPVTTIRFTVPSWARSGPASVVTISSLSGRSSYGLTVGLPVTGGSAPVLPGAVGLLCLVGAAIALRRARALGHRIERLGGAVSR